MTRPPRPPGPPQRRATGLGATHAARAALAHLACIAGLAGLAGLGALPRLAGPGALARFAGRAALVTLTAALALHASAQAANDSREQLERRVQSVAALIESSSAARQIEASGDAAAREKRNNARLIHREAAATLRGGDTAGAARLLEQATREMINGARLAKPEQVAGVKDKRDYETRLDSARALLSAQQRITQEKGNQPPAQQATREIESLITAAERRAAEGKLAEARPLLERAYLTARVSIESLRRGDTLVRSLTFASAKEEFAYEQDRYQTHRMLIQVLVADRGTSPALMQGFIDRAAVLREAAEAQAAGGDHAAGVKGLEEATRELVRAIRAAGLYIPG
ncbi:MAG: hypothetical protein JNL30_17285 [Rubrivivax sp.]|nr:hypothetical protein [Rubrivivax sp.]